MPRRIPRILTTLLLLLATGVAGYALDPRKSLTQYSRSSWTQRLGLPQNSIRAMAQTTDGYLWIGTREGIARFDGFQFTAFNREHGDLPSNTIYARASQVRLTLAVSVDTLNLRVADDGQGFQPENTFIAYKGHFSLLRVRERAQALGGELRVESEPGKGTRLLVSAPV